MGEAKRKAEAKKELFEKEPEKFVHIDELVFAIMEDEEGLKHMCNLKRANRFQQAIGIAVMELPGAFAHALMLKKQHEKNIVVPG